MFDTAIVTCPYCYEQIEVDIDPQTEGEVIRDCDVCCRPWTLQITRGPDGQLYVDAGRAQ